MKRALYALLLAPLAWSGVWSTAAFAQDEDEEDMDSEDEESSEDKRAAAADAEVREITRGTYAKINVGGALYLGQFRQTVRNGTSMGLAFGRDFINQERNSAAWELMFFQGIHNGTYYEDQAAAGCVQTGTCVQGDLRTYTFAGALEYSIYPGRRVGVGIRAGGGVLLSPLLMDQTFWQEEVVGKAFEGNDFGYHDTPHPVVLGGPTFEYYTKLAHFSAGLDADVFYAIGFDLGTSITGALKYTF